MMIRDLRFVICLGFWIWCSEFAQGSDLRFRFQPGDKFYLETTTENKTTIIVDGNERALEQMSRLGCDLDIEEVEENGNAWARFIYRQTAMKMKGAGVDVAFDSEANSSSLPEPGPASPAKPGPAFGESRGERGASQPRRIGVPLQALPLVLMLNEGFFVKITPQGRIEKINGLPVIVSAARGKLPNIEGKEQVIQAIRKRFEESVIKRELEDLLAVFPDLSSAAPMSFIGAKSDACQAPNGVGVGATWSNSEQIAEQGVVVEKAWRLTNLPVAGRGAIIDVNIIISPDVNADVNAEDVMLGNFKARREVSGRGTGQIEIDPEGAATQGRIVKSTLTEDLVEEVRFLARGLTRRVPPPPEPTRTHIVITFQMTRREPDKGSPGSSSEPNQPATSKVEGP